jgi:alpha-D-ribose 1-methylphosphonate 5-triphosphate diphosphatase
VVDGLEKYIDEPILALVSFMDHTPGQRQWSDIRMWRLFHSDEKWSDEQAAELLQKLREKQDRNARKNQLAIAKLAKERGLPLASHDDTLARHVDEAHELGVVISEFPTTLEAAQRAIELGMHVVGGTPNLVRGESHSGNISMRELARRHALDCLSSDYVPVSLLHAVFVLHQEMDFELPKAMQMVTAIPADALGLKDRGRLEPGLRADLVRVRMVDDLPVVIGVWRKGRQVF